MRKLEERFPSEVVVIGVHSAKFPAETLTYNIRQAVLRHDIRHPVVNDREFRIWRAYGVRAWPTLVIVDPEGCVVGAHAGEFDGETLGRFVESMIAAFDAEGKIDRTPLRLALEKQKQVETLLSFPGKLFALPVGVEPAFPGGALFVADTEHHRIVAFPRDGGRPLAVWGGGEPGFRDGGADTGRFRAPQGLTVRDGCLYVADTENHAVRRIDLATGSITTVAGTGRQADPWPAPGQARSARLNSPWDLLAVGERLFIAMAGSHQIWTLQLPAGTLERFAGDGHEALLDGPRLEARLAQPSGLATDGETLWFADSESSSLRSVPLAGAGEVRTHVGQGLFEFGDRDGGRAEARMQHPLAVACAGGLVFVADAYNNKLRVFDPQRGVLSTLAGNGEPGLQDGPPHEASFWEPGGLSVADGLLWVADTNNHAIRRVDPATGEVHTVPLEE